MLTKAKIELLKKTDLFQSYDSSILEQLIDHCEEIVLAPNEVLFKEGSLETAMYLILLGQIEIYKGPKQIAVISEGQYLGEMSLLESKERSASARAVKSSTLLQINKDQFDTYLATEPKALLSMMRTLSGRIRVDLASMMEEMRKLSMFTHDIKNNLSPLSMTEGMLEDLIEVFRGKGKQKPRDGLEDMEDCFEALHTVKDTLMTLIEASLNHVKKVKVPYIKIHQDILPVLHETVKGISTHKYLVGKKVEVQSKGDNLQAYFNALDIKRVIQNLVINAGYVTEDGGTIVVFVEPADKNLQVRVTDTGCGIPEEIQPYLFKEVMTTKKDGNGLGLLSCKDIIEENHQGKFWFESKTGEGTSFFFSFPLQKTI